MSGSPPPKTITRCIRNPPVFDSKCLLLSTVLGVSTYSVDPGMVDTEITRHFMRPLASFIKTFGFLIRTPAEGAYTTIYCTVTPENQLRSGGYYR